MSRLRCARPFSLALALALFTAGCGGGPSHSSINADGDAKHISHAVDQFNESRMKEKDSEPLFAKGAMPKGREFKRYGGYSYFPTGRARRDGDAATLEVTVRDEKTGEEAGKIEWSFKKEGDAWKIAKAPLP